MPTQVFVMPVGSDRVREHMNNTLLDKVSKGEIEKRDIHLPDGMYENGEINVWGLVPGPRNILQWKGFSAGDICIFVPTDSNLLVTEILSKTQNKNLATDLWGVDEHRQTWELIFFVKEIGTLQMSKREFLAKLGYTKKKDYLMGNRKVTPKFLSAYGSITNFLNSNSGQMVSTEILQQETTERIINDLLPKKITAEEKLKTLGKAIETNSSTTDDYIVFKGKRIKRNQLVVTYVKIRDNYTCRACGFTLTKKDGTKYIEAAHIVRRAPRAGESAGPDTPDNIVSLCPNCHKKLDLGDDEAKHEVTHAINSS